jgi:hypothetical protein
MSTKMLDIRNMNKYCVVCGKEFGPHLETHCTDNSLVVIARTGFRRIAAYYSLDGKKLTDSDLTALKNTETARKETWKQSSIESKKRIQRAPRPKSFVNVNLPASGLIGGSHSEFSDGNTIENRAVQLQRAYWTYNPAEKESLLTRYPDSLSWPELLRLHHLACLELMNGVDGNAHWGELDHGQDAPKGAASELCTEVLQRLLSPNSPYKERHCAVWQGQPGQSEQRPPDMQGRMRNASLTHLGCLEAIRLDQHKQPIELIFIPFDDIRGVLLARPCLYRAARIFYEDARDEMVWIPLNYGISWFTHNQYDHDGTLTRFCCHLHTGEFSISIGIGHQDFVLAEPGTRGQHLFGLGSIGELMFALEISDPKFDQKCRASGLEPSTIRQQMEKGSRYTNHGFLRRMINQILMVFALRTTKDRKQKAAQHLGEG